MIKGKAIMAKKIKANDATSFGEAIQEFLDRPDVYVISMECNASMTYSFVELCSKEEIYYAVLTYQNIENP